MAGDIVAFYIKNYIYDGVLVTAESKFQTIPFSSAPVINNPKAKIELGKAGSFEFEVDPTSPYYNAFQQMKTVVRIEYFGHCIFRGRVLTIDKKMQGIRTIHCEGDLAFLLDSHQIGTKEDTRQEITVLEYLQQIINQHNADMSSDTGKQFSLGEVPGQYSSSTSNSQKVVIPTDKAKQKFGDTSWNTSMDRLEGLLSDFGGYFRTRYDSGTIYLDWYDKYYNASLNPQTIEVTKNLIDLSGVTEVNNLFTVIVPLGKDKNGNNVQINDYWPIVSSSHNKVSYITVPELASIPLYSDSELNSDYHRKEDYQNAITKFGWIWKPVDFENADTPEKLFAYAKDWMKNNFSPEITQWSISALDMRIVDPETQYILCGDKVNLVHPEVSNVFTGMTVISAEYAFFDPKNNKYTIGIPNQEINASYGTKTKSKGKNGGSNLSNKNDNSSETDKQAQDIAKLKLYLDTQYYRKTESGADITLDNPLAFTSYNTDGTEKDKSEAIKDLIATASELMQTKRQKFAEISAEAARRGVSVNDVQLLVDYTPSVKQKQTQYRTQSSAYFVNTVGMTMQQAEVLVNETASQSFLASLVDDDGNWTPYALGQGATIWNNSADIKEQAINTRKWLSGKDLPNSTMANASKAIQSFTEFLSGDALNIDNILNTDKVTDTVEQTVDKVVNMFDGNFNFHSVNKPETSGQGTWDQNTFDFFGLFSGNNTEDDGKEFTFESDTANIDGVDGKSQFGKDNQGNWRVKINETVTYEGSDGHQHTDPGFVCANDFNIPSLPSLKTKLLVTDLLIAGKVDAAEIEADLAYLRKINSETISAGTYIAALTAYFNTINTTGNIVMGGGGNTHLSYQLSNASFRHMDDCLYDVDITESNGVITISLARLNGSTAASDSFNMAATSFYQNAVAAAKDTGAQGVAVGGVVYSPGSGDSADFTLSSGQWLKVGGTYVDKNGQTVQIPSYKLVKAASGGSISGSDIKIRNYGSSSSGTSAPSMKSGILQAIDRGTYFSFEVYVDGTSASKTYVLDFR